jgi:hypothetical protein
MTSKPRESMVIQLTIKKRLQNMRKVFINLKKNSPYVQTAIGGNSFSLQVKRMDNSVGAQALQQAGWLLLLQPPAL